MNKIVSAALMSLIVAGVCMGADGTAAAGAAGAVTASAAEVAEVAETVIQQAEPSTADRAMFAVNNL